MTSLLYWGTWTRVALTGLLCAGLWLLVLWVTH
jgi:hypothetical protein